MTKLIDIVSQTYEAGGVNAGEASIEAGVNSIRLILSREKWPATGLDVVATQVDISLDGGATWIAPYVGFTAPGGTFFNDDGNTATQSIVEVLLPKQQGLTKRLMRATVDVKTALMTGLSVEVN